MHEKAERSCKCGAFNSKGNRISGGYYAAGIEKICTSGHDVFIENTALLLANADMKYTEQLYSVFPDIRNAYARSELCLVFGITKKTEYLPLLLEQFERIKEERPDMDYEQGPLLAIYLIFGKL